MRVVGVVFALALGLSACVSVGPPLPTPNSPPPPTPSPTLAPTPTPSPTPSPTPAPTPGPTAAPTASTEVSASPDPNTTPEPTVIDLAPYLTSEITVVNLAASKLSLTVTILATDGPDEYELGTFEVQPEQVTTQAVVPTRYRLDFALAGGGGSEACTIDVGDGEQLQFAVIEDGIVLASNGPEPADPAEMLVLTSSRCRAGEPT